MRVLLIAYEFPPSPSPQSLRWTYLARELDRLGHEVHVLTPDLGGTTPGLPQLPSSIRVHRTFPGLLRGALAMHRDYRMRHPRREEKTLRVAENAEDGSTTPASPTPALGQLRPARNWKQRISEVVQAFAAWMHFPDIRGEWRWWGQRALRRLAQSFTPDVIISSHEPATSLQLGLLATDIFGKPWVADLGDPVLAPYTPARWKRRSLAIERAVCKKAAAITVTSDGTADLLRERHARNHGIHVLTQGFDLSPPSVASDATAFEAARLELLYTGSLYTFRRIDTLLHTIASLDGVRLSIAAVTVPESILAMAKKHPSSIRLLGFLPHDRARSLQRSADVLVNLANDDPVQIPGKFHEYLGAGRPILHLASSDDAVSHQILTLRRGWTSTQDSEALSAILLRLRALKTEGRLDEALSLGMDSVYGSSWQSIALQLEKIIEGVADTGARKSARTP